MNTCNMSMKTTLSTLPVCIAKENEFQIKVVEELHYLCSKNKGTMILICAFVFPICKKHFLSRHGSYFISQSLPVEFGLGLRVPGGGGARSPGLLIEGLCWPICGCNE